MMFISVIIPCFNEEKHIEECLKSIINQDCQKENFEVLCIDGMSYDKTRQIIQYFTDEYQFIKLIDNPDRIVSYALNKGIVVSRGNVIIRIDAHCVYPKNYISVLVNKLFELNADNVGGLWKTNPGCPSRICEAIAIASSNSFGVGNSLHKTGTSKVVKTDTVPFGCFRRDVFDRIGLFDPDLIRNQDDEFNGRIIKNGGTIFLVPDVVIDYYARDTLRKMGQMYYQYGLFKPLVNKKLGSPATLRQLAPPLFVTSILLGFVLCLFMSVLLPFYLGFISLYLLISVGVSVKEAIRNNSIFLIALLPVVFFIIHFSYGWGYLSGIAKFLIFRTGSVTANINR
ncbi:MAG TPA: glycosyltransferase family 2 protein [Bacteroidales bacterium]|jgi:glycosyltransferase involved in cell wall biosynthesis|nr:glycosyltransferase family 2 protein [Bacteroidales bacterium]